MNQESQIREVLTSKEIKIFNQRAIQKALIKILDQIQSLADFRQQRHHSYHADLVLMNRHQQEYQCSLELGFYEYNHQPGRLCLYLYNKYESVALITTWFLIEFSRQNSAKLESEVNLGVEIDWKTVGIGTALANAMKIVLPRFKADLLDLSRRKELKILIKDGTSGLENGWTDRMGKREALRNIRNWPVYIKKIFTGKFYFKI